MLTSPLSPQNRLELASVRLHWDPPCWVNTHMIMYMQTHIQMTDTFVYIWTSEWATVALILTLLCGYCMSSVCLVDFWAQELSMTHPSLTLSPLASHGCPHLTQLPPASPGYPPPSPGYPLPHPVALRLIGLPPDSSGCPLPRPVAPWLTLYHPVSPCLILSPSAFLYLAL